MGLGWIRLPVACAIGSALAVLCVSRLAFGTGPVGPVVASSFRPGGEPLILASDGRGGIWYGGAAPYVVSDEPEAEASMWHLAAGGGVTRVQLPIEPAVRFVQDFAVGPDGTEWVLTGTDANSSEELDQVSASGALTMSAVPLEKGARLRGLTDSHGNLWSAESGHEGGRQLAGIVRIVPGGQVSVFKKGLMKGAIPANVVAGPDGTVWFLDDAGRIGRVLPDGQLHETPIGRHVLVETRPFAPPRPMLLAGGDIWFVAGPETIGRMSMSGRASFIAPRSSYRGIEAQGARDGDLVGLAIAPGGDVWFTRDSGEVGRIEPGGRVQTITNRLVGAYGIAFDGRGRAWVGEGPGYQRKHLGETPFERDMEQQMARPRIEPARLAEVEPSGGATQFPPAPSCRVPSLIGVERSLVWLEDTVPFGVGNEEQSLSLCEHRIRLRHVTIRRAGRRGRLFVIAQHPAAGRHTRGYVGVSITLAVASAPRGCGVPRPLSTLFRSSRLVVWRVATAAPEQEGVRETYYACVPPLGKVRRITWDGSENVEAGSTVARMAFAGHYLAYVTRYGSKYGSSVTLTVENIASGSVSKTETDSYASEYGGAPGPLQLPQLERLGPPFGRGVYQFALGANGDVAWVGHTEVAAGVPTQAVLYLSGHRHIEKLAVGQRIDGLHFSGSLLRLQVDGEERSIRT
jgi:streptogramin lyase